MVSLLVSAILLTSCIVLGCSVPEPPLVDSTLLAQSFNLTHTAVIPFLDKLCQNAYYNKLYDIGRRACTQQVLLTRLTDWRAVRNLHFYYSTAASDDFDYCIGIPSTNVDTVRYAHILPAVYAAVQEQWTETLEAPRIAIVAASNIDVVCGNTAPSHRIAIERTLLSAWYSPLFAIPLLDQIVRSAPVDVLFFLDSFTQRCQYVANTLHALGLRVEMIVADQPESSILLRQAELLRNARIVMYVAPQQALVSQAPLHYILPVVATGGGIVMVVEHNAVIASAAHSQADDLILAQLVQLTPYKDLVDRVSSLLRMGTTEREELGARATSALKNVEYYPVFLKS